MDIPTAKAYVKAQITDSKDEVRIFLLNALETGKIISSAVCGEDEAGLRDMFSRHRSGTGDATLGNGLPELVQNLTLSSPSVPPEKEHASCHRIVRDLPYGTAPSVNISCADNTVWRKAYTRSDGTRYLHYSCESNIVYIVRRFMEDILLALDLHLDVNQEVTIQQVRPNLSVILLGMYFVGVVEVKKPGKDILLKPTVLGELLDQMLLVEGFYGMGPVIGILTTGDDWVVSWFPADQQVLEECKSKEEASFSTPVKPTTRDGPEPPAKGHSPSGGTPSQRAGRVHTIENVVDIPSSISDEDNSEINQQIERELCTTEVVSIRTNPHQVLQLLCRAFQLMAMAHTHYSGKLSRCLLKFHKDLSAVTFHPASYKDILPLVDFSKFPAKTVKNLIALEDLGRGSTGKAWLCVTVTKPRSAACVLKFDNQGASAKLMHEFDMWSLLYPEFSTMIKLEQWSGSDALVMPHFSTVLEHEREQYKDELVDVLTNKFMENRKVHKDVRWRNIGKYRSKSGSIVLVVFDLYDVVDYDVDTHRDWIETVVASLYKVGLNVVHVSRDKDMLQLVDTGVYVMQALDTLLDADEVMLKYGVSPNQLCDYQAIIGDSAVLIQSTTVFIAEVSDRYMAEQVRVSNNRATAQRKVASSVKILRYLYKDVDGREVSLHHRKSVRSDDQSAVNDAHLTYGEVNPQSFLQILALVDNLHKSLPNQHQSQSRVFVDLGCGTGLAVLCAALSPCEYTKVYGIELVPGLTDEALRCRQSLLDLMAHPQSLTSSVSGDTKVPKKSKGVDASNVLSTSLRFLREYLTANNTNSMSVEGYANLLCKELGHKVYKALIIKTYKSFIKYLKSCSLFVLTENDTVVQPSISSDGNSDLGGDDDHCDNNDVISTNASSSSSGAKIDLSDLLVYSNSLPEIVFETNDIFEVDWHCEADVVYAASLLFSEDMMVQLSERVHRMKSGSFFINLRELPPPVNSDRRVELVSESFFKMSWQMAKVYIYRIT